MPAPNDNVDLAVEAIVVGGTYLSNLVAQTDATREDTGWIEPGFPVVPENATFNEYEPTHTWRTLWWRYRPSSSGTVTVDSLPSPGDSGNNNDIQLEVYQLRPGGIRRAMNVVSYSSKSEGVGYRDKLSFGAVGGETYFIQVGHYSSSGDIPGVRISVSGPDSVPDWLEVSVLDETETTIEVQWAYPPANVTGFELSLNGGAPIDVGFTTAHIFTGLASNTAYTIGVRAYHDTPLTFGSNHTAVSWSTDAADGASSASKAGDGNPATYFRTFNAAATLTADMGVERTVGFYSLLKAPDYAPATPSNWKFQGSADGSSWNTLHEIYFQHPNDFLGNPTPNVYIPDYRGAYRYYRLNVARTNGVLDVAELVFGGEPLTFNRTLSDYDETTGTTEEAAIVALPPENLSGTGGLRTVELTWDAPAGPAPTGYYVREGLGPITDAGGTTYTFYGLDPSTEYTFEVRSYYGAGEDQVESEPALVTVSTSTPLPPYLNEPEVTIDSIEVSWTPPPGQAPDGYYVRLNLGPIEDAGGMSRLFDGLEADTAYDVQVKSYYGSGVDQVESGWASIIVLTLPPPYTYSTRIGAAPAVRYRVGSAPALRVYLGETLVHEGD